MRAALFVCLVLVGCTRAVDSCGRKVLTLWPSATDAYEFRVVELDTLNSVERLEGSAARIFSASALEANGYAGTPAEPHLTRTSDGVCVPRDVESAVAVNAYAQFESLYHFERELGTESQIAWPRAVGVGIKLLAPDADAYNNAHYYGAQDAIALVPYTKNGLPISFNSGIVSHEHFHAHFQAMVTGPLDDALRIAARSLDLDRIFGPLSARPLAVADTVNVDLRSAAGLNAFVVRGWNEGLADFFASVYTGKHDLFSPSLNVRARDLDGEARSMRAGADLTALAETRLYDRAFKIRQLTGTAYDEGTTLARFLHHLAKQDPGGPRAFLRRIMDRLPALAPSFVGAYDRHRLDFADVLLVLLKGEKLGRDACFSLKVVDPDATAKEYPTCARYFTSI